MRKIIPLLLLLAGCSGVPTLPGITPYKMDIQQGNYVTQQMVAKLKPGMTRSQVRFILGTPLVVDMFRTNRWDYIYIYEKRGKVTEQRRIAVIFEDDKLARVEGDVVPAQGGANLTTTSGEPVKAEAPGAAPVKPESAAEKPQEEKGFFGRMLDKIGF